MKFLRANLLSMITLLVMAASSLFLLGDLPDRLPTDFALDGSVRGTRSKYMVAMSLPLVYLLLMTLINVLINISPQKFSMPNSKRAMHMILFGTGLLLLCLHYGLLENAGDFAFFVTCTGYGVALFLIVVGNVFGKTERNFFIGIRLPWTIASEGNWKATHRFAGKLMFVTGFALLVLNTLYSNIFIVAALAGVSFVLPVVYSLLHYFRFEKEHQAN